MTEEDFATALYPFARTVARQFAAKVKIPNAADDMAQVAMIGLLEYFRRRGEAPDERLAAVIARRRMIEMLRAAFGRRGQRSTLQLTLIDDKDRGYIEEGSTRDGEASRAALIDLRTELRRLPAAERRVLRLIAEGETQREIARRMGLHETRVSQIRRQAIERLRRKLLESMPTSKLEIA